MRRSLVTCGPPRKGAYALDMDGAILIGEQGRNSKEHQSGTHLPSVDLKR